MKRQELDQLRQKSKTELLKDMGEIRHEIVDMRLKKGQQILTNTNAIRNARRKLAVLETFVRTKD